MEQKSEIFNFSNFSNLFSFPVSAPIDLNLGITTLKNLGVTIGSFTSRELFFERLSGKFAYLAHVLGHGSFGLKRTTVLPTGATVDTIVARSASNLLCEDKMFKGFCKVTEQKFNEQLIERSTKYGQDVKRSFKRRAIKLMLTPSQLKVKRKTLAKAVQLVKRDLQVDQAKLKPATIEEAALNLKLDAGSGFWWFTKKSNVIGEIFSAGRFFFELPLNDLAALIAFPAYVAYRVQQRASGCKLRIIYVYPAVVTLFEQVFLTPILAFFQQRKASTPYCIGNVGQDLVSRYAVWQQRNKVVSIDWSSFDQSANAYLIKESFSIIRGMFPNLGRVESAIFDLVTFFFMFTPIYTTDLGSDDEKIVFKKRGIPSGSSFTNLIGTIVNLIATYSYLIEMGYEVDGNYVASLGDDIVIATNSNFSLSHFAETMFEWYGMSVSAEKSAIFSKGQKVYFLGALFDTNGRYINAELALYQCSLTTSDLFVKCTTSLDHYNRIRDKVASICFKYSNGYIVYDKLMAAVRQYLDLFNYDDSYYKEVNVRAVAPEIRVPKNRILNTSVMRIHGWLLQ